MKFMIILTLFLIFVCKAQAQLDTCETTLHPTYFILGTCMDSTLCTNSGGITLSNWCQSKPNNVKCCFMVTAGVKTVQNVLNEAGCSTQVIKGLSAQLVTKMNQIKPGLMSTLSGIIGISLSASTAAVPYLQTTALNAIKKAVIARGGVTLAINSGLRTLPQQLLLYKWYQQGKCGITLAASPGSSNHESGLAVDINDYSGWMSYMTSNGCSWQGASDVVHFNCPGISLGTTSVLAFQRLWNCNNPNDKIAEDGIYGSNTEARILKSPIDGFPMTC